MPQEKLNDTIVKWAFDSLASGAFWTSGILICISIFFIYSRSGSLFFIRDIIWRLVGATIKFENSKYEESRKALREVEHYRFEFNIPAQTLEQADLAEHWILKNNFAHRDIAKLKRYINWKNFNEIHFKTELFSKTSERIAIGALLISILAIIAAPPAASSDYLLVSLKDSPSTPSFYLSESNAKFGMFSDSFLTTDDCSSPSALEKFTTSTITDENLNSICSLFLDPKYSEHINNTLKEQRFFAFWAASFAMIIVFSQLVRLTRIGIARKLNKKLESDENTKDHKLNTN